MREIAFASQLKNKHIIDFISEKVKSKIDFCKTIVTTYLDNNFAYLLFACEEEFYAQCEVVLANVIIDYIETVYKVEYLKDKIKNPAGDTLTFNAYIKVLSVFDRSTDETALKKIMVFNQTFFLDSFFEFRLKPLKQHWDNLAELSSDNIAMFNSGTFVDVIRFLINTMDNVVYKVKVIMNGEKCSIYNMKNKNAKIKKIADCTSPLDLISNVLNYCPNYIDVYLDTNRDDEAVNFLSNIFTSRLKIYTKV